MPAESRAPSEPGPRPIFDPARGLISRPRLCERLRSWAGYPIILVSAPAGYGKSTVISEWAGLDPRPFAWMTLDALDDDPNLLGGRIAASLDAIEPVDPAVFDLLAAPRPSLARTVAPRLAGAVARREQPFVLVLDDLHTVRESQSLDLITTIAAQLPSGSQIVLISRGEPAIGVGGLRGHGRLAELDASRLAMTRSEATGLLDAAGVTLSEEAVRELVAHTEGWPVAIYLAARVLAEEPDPDETLTRFTGEDRAVADYLRDELLSTLEADDLDFLMACSILEKLDGALCDAVLERTGSAATLRRLSRSNLLVIPLDRTDHEYRYHALLREMLRGELDRLGLERARQLHRRASAFYADGGDFDSAIAHAIEARDIAGSGALLWASAAEYASHGRLATLTRFLSEFSDAELSESPALALAMATSQLTAGAGAEIDRWTAAAVRSLENAPAGQREQLRLGADLIRAAGATRGELAEMARGARLARERLPDDSPWVSLACFIEGVAAHLAGDLAAARLLLEDAIRRGDVAAPTIRTLSLAQLALLAFEEGGEDEAWRLDEQAAAAVDRFGLGEFPTEALVFATSALARARRGSVDKALLAARHAAALIARLPGTSAWFEAETRIVLARALLILDDVGAAQAQLAEAEPFVRMTPDGPGLTRLFADVQSEAEAASSAGGRWPLTPAELRLLHLLPTHLSFRQIAEELYVSVNTVKSQARSVYRKLGVGSRAEAVAAARAGGLVGGAETSDRAEPARPRR